MANFKTHIQGALISTTAACIFASEIHLMAWEEAPIFILLGVVGGILPDIDADNSKQLHWLFLLLALSAVVFVFNNSEFLVDLAIAQSLNLDFCDFLQSQGLEGIQSLAFLCERFATVILALLTFLFVRILCLALFQKLTVHRGVFHSVLSGLFFSLLVCSLLYHWGHLTAYKSWLYGVFLGFGFLVHLLLDELYSVDLTNARLKRSFGSALKLFNYTDIWSSSLMAAATIGVYALTPSFYPLFAEISERI